MSARHLVRAGLLSIPLLATACGGDAPSIKLETTTVPVAGARVVAMADVNGDGKADLVVATQAVSVCLNATEPGAPVPSFTCSGDFATGASPISVAIGDLNGDGMPDLAVANLGASSVSVLLNLGAGGFATKVDFPTGEQPSSVALGDFNGDGAPDLVVANFGSGTGNTVSVLMNTTVTGGTTPSFAGKVDLTTGMAPNSVAVADFNMDGKPDIAVANYNAPFGGSAGVSVFLDLTPAGAASPSFSSGVAFPTTNSPSSVAVGDFNGDGKPDLVATDYTNGSNSTPPNPSNAHTVSLLTNLTPSTSTSPAFAAPVDFAVEDNPYAVAVGDFDGDGKPDLAVANTGAMTVSVLVDTTRANATSASFQPKVDFPTGPNVLSVATGDASGDGKADIAVPVPSGVLLLFGG